MRPRTELLRSGRAAVSWSFPAYAARLGAVSSDPAARLMGLFGAWPPAQGRCLVGLAGCLDGPLSFGLRLGGGKKRTAVKGREAAERQRSLPFTPEAFLRGSKPALLGERSEGDRGRNARDRRGREGQTG